MKNVVVAELKETMIAIKVLERCLLAAEKEYRALITARDVFKKLSDVKKPPTQP